MPSPERRTAFWTPGQPWSGVRSWLIPQVFRAAHCGAVAGLSITSSGLWRCRPYLEEPQALGAIFTCWHSDILFPMHLFRHQGMSAMFNPDRWGRLAARVWRLYGWSSVFGVTGSREAVRALLQVSRLLQSGRSMAIALDGPGPYHQPHPGAVYLASRCGAEVIPLGVAMAPEWRFKSWDRTLVPRPFAHAHVHLGPALTVPRRLVDDDVNIWRQRLAEAVDAAAAVAERRVRQDPDS